jgi:hypothetical protein
VDWCFVTHRSGVSISDIQSLSNQAEFWVITVFGHASHQLHNMQLKVIMLDWPWRPMSSLFVVGVAVQTIFSSASIKVLLGFSVSVGFLFENWPLSIISVAAPLHATHVFT